ncbi:hypothetical protein KKG08_00855, partial [Patescibacteria group bacterium]|nr:hypothetical protein [Patescibacteria group bacterium]
FYVFLSIVVLIIFFAINIPTRLLKEISHSRDLKQVERSAFNQLLERTPPEGIEVTYFSTGEVANIEKMRAIINEYIEFGSVTSGENINYDLGEIVSVDLDRNTVTLKIVYSDNSSSIGETKNINVGFTNENTVFIPELALGSGEVGGELTTRERNGCIFGESYIGGQISDFQSLMLSCLLERDLLAVLKGGIADIETSYMYYMVDR